MIPGCTAFTRMPSSPSSSAAYPQSASMPALAIPYAVNQRCGKCPAPEDMRTIAPPRPSADIERAACFTQRKDPMRFRSTVARTASTSAFTSGPRWKEPPAQAKTMSRCPVGSPARATAAATWSSTVTSATTKCWVVPAAASARITSSAAASLSSVRPQMVTEAPSAASRRAERSPMPLPPPVTRALRPSSPPLVAGRALSPTFGTGVLAVRAGPQRAGAPRGALGVKVTGIDSMPEMKLAGRRGGSRSSVSARSGRRSSNCSNMTRSSRRASWLPRQK